MTQTKNQFAPSISPKGQIVFNWPAEAKELHPNAPLAALLAGARFSTKTNTVLNVDLRHLWETPGASMCAFAKSVKALTDNGPFEQLIEDVLPDWVNRMGMKVLSKNRRGETGPIVDSKTRTVYVEVSNFYNGKSKLLLNSIQHDAEIEEKLKGKSYSAIWLSELNQFDDPAVFTNAMMTLRMMHLAPHQHLFIADTNPSKQGVDSWIYKKWFLKLKALTAEHIAKHGPPNEELIRSLRMMEFFLEDNTFITEARRNIIRATYQDDPLEYEREIEGKWVKGLAKNKIFSNVWDKNRHAVGVKDDENPARGQVKLAADTTQLYSGWDIGSGANHAAGMIEKRMIIRPAGAVSAFIVLTSLRQMDEVAKVSDFTLDFMEKKKEIEGKYKDRAFHWIHYADDSAINQPRNAGAGYDYLEVQIASKNEINLIGVPKPKNSVGVRKKLLRRLLRENRLFVAAQCEDVIAMFEDATQSTKEEVEWGEHKHVFDWISYVLYMLCFDELEEMADGPRPAESSFVSVPLG